MKFIMGLIIGYIGAVMIGGAWYNTLGEIWKEATGSQV